MTTPTETRPCKKWCGEEIAACNYEGGCYPSDNKCWCSAGCRDAGRRLGDAAPRVISGLDTAAATPDVEPCGRPVKHPGNASLYFCVLGRGHAGACEDWTAAPPPPARPSRVEVGQRRRDKWGQEFTVLGKHQEGDAWDVRLSSDGAMSWRLSREILDAEYLGTVPASLATPTPSREAVPGHATNDVGDCQPWCQGCEWRTRRGLPTDWEPAAPPARPSRVEVGHAWRVGRKLGRTLYRDGECVGIVDTPHLAEQIVAALGTVPAPVSAPTGEASAALDTRDGPYCMGCHQHVEKCDTDAECETCPGRAARAAASAPGQSTPVETPPVMWQGSPDGGKTWRDMPRETALTYAQCRPKPRAAAPAPGAGEGPRELTFLEAAEAAAAGKELEYQVPGSAGWLPSNELRPGKTIGVARLADLVNNRYRLKPEPLPAPAPRVSRVRALGEAYEEATEREKSISDLLERVVEETLKAVRATYNPLEDVAKALDRARAAMLEPR